MPDTGVFDVIVIGAGHAGVEAALAASRMGVSVLLVTLDIGRIGQMSCNPSIGGLAKGHLVKEIDALGGEIGLLADRTALQFRMLNVSKGPAVWSPRTQNDRMRYQREAHLTLTAQKNITIKQDEVEDILVHNRTAIGVRTKNSAEFRSKAVILTTGTFLNGLMHIGSETQPGGRLNEGVSTILPHSLNQLGLKTGRLKTGTSPRIAADRVNYSGLKIQMGDEPPRPFSLRTCIPVMNLLPCYITRTTRETHQIITDNLDRSPLYTGRITGIGPRYCPSLETKIIRFADRPYHTVFIEPEGINHPEVYLNGFSTSMPLDVQIAMVRSVPGLENAVITQPGYAVEYDFIYPVQLYSTLETKTIRFLYCAGQINGTSGYEEAAAQGLIAGINAVLKIKNEKPFILKRYEAYIGVLIDDLVTKNITEPYRMFTSLAEHRLILRIDNVADRLMKYGVAFGLIDTAVYEQANHDRQAIIDMKNTLANIFIPVNTANPYLRQKGETEIPIENGGQTLHQLLKRPGLTWQDIARLGGLDFDPALGKRVEYETKYEGYIQRENDLIAKLTNMERETLPADIDYSTVRGLSNEAVNKLNEIKPLNLDQASRIQGIGPTEILNILLHLKKTSKSPEKS